MPVNNVRYIYTYGRRSQRGRTFAARVAYERASRRFLAWCHGRQHNDGGDARFASYLAVSGIGWSEDIHDLICEFRACRRDQTGTLLEPRQRTERIAFLDYDRTSGLFYGK